MRAILVTGRPISGRCVNLGFRGHFRGKSESRISAPRREFMRGWEALEVIGRPDRAFYRRLRAQTGPENRPVAPTGGGPSLRAILLTCHPISGRCVNLGFRDAFSGEVGTSVLGGAFPAAPIARFKGGSGRRRGPQIDQSRVLAGAHLWEQFCSQVQDGGISPTNGS